MCIFQWKNRIHQQYRKHCHRKLLLHKDLQEQVLHKYLS
jgi:hypothetical protein